MPSILPEFLRRARAAAKAGAVLARVALIVLSAAFAAAPVAAKDAPPAVADPALEARMQAIAIELRCLVCQNQTIADSNADLAVDLRNQVREMLRQGKTNREIIDYMTARYGDFVLYRPPVRTTTALLWFGPLVLLVGGLAVLVLVLRRRSRLAADAFEPDDAEEPFPAEPASGRAAEGPAARSPSPASPAR